MKEFINVSLDETSANYLKVAFEAFLKVYAPDPQAKDTLLSSFDKRFKKPIPTDVQTHWNRRDLIMDYIDQLQGEVTQDLTNNQRKMMFYNTFPAKWRNVLATSKDLYKSSATDIKNFMLLKKKKADAEDKVNKSKTNKDNDNHLIKRQHIGARFQRDGGRKGRFSRGGQSRGRDGGARSTKIDGNKPCPIHPGKITRESNAAIIITNGGRGSYYNYHQHQNQYDHNYHQNSQGPPQDLFTNYPSNISVYGNSTISGLLPLSCNGSYQGGYYHSSLSC